MDREQALDAALGQIERAFGKGSVMRMSDRPQVPGVQMPVSQIAIELYAPLPGGIAAGGRFAPATVKVKGLVDVPSAPK